MAINGWIGLLFGHYGLGAFYISPMWFLPAMASTSILLALYCSFTTKLTKCLYIIASCAFFCYCKIHNITLPWSIHCAPLYFLIFLTAYYLRDKIFSYVNRIDYSSCGVFLVLVATYALKWNIVVNIGNSLALWLFLYFAIGFIYTIIIAFVCRHVRLLQSRIVIAVGQFSLTLMCIHMPIYVACKGALRMCGADLGIYGEGICCFPVAVAVGLALRSVFLRLAPRYPILKWLY